MNRTHELNYIYPNDRWTNLGVIWPDSFKKGDVCRRNLTKSTTDDRRQMEITFCPLNHMRENKVLSY